MIFILLLFSWIVPESMQPMIIDHYDKSGYFNGILSDISDDKMDVNSTIKAVLQWQSENMQDDLTASRRLTGISLLVYVTLSSPYEMYVRPDSSNNPKWSLIIKRGACQEAALAFMELANYENLTARAIILPANGHAFDEVLISNSWWMTVDPSLTVLGPNDFPNDSIQGYNFDPRAYEKPDWNYTIPYVYGFYPNGSTLDVTSDTHYTNTSNVYLHVVDSDNNPIENASIIVTVNIGSPDIARFTDQNGNCHLILGGGNYTIGITDGWLFNSTTLFIKEGVDVNQTIIMRNFGIF
jgi:hypothetical protein